MPAETSRSFRDITRAARPSAGTERACRAIGAPTTCPACGFLGSGIRCIRCNALKLAACSGACASCLLGTR